MLGKSSILVDELFRAILFNFCLVLLAVGVGFGCSD